MLQLIFFVFSLIFSILIDLKHIYLPYVKHAQVSLCYKYTARYI